MLTREQFRKQNNKNKKKVSKQKRQKQNVIIRVLIGIVLVIYYLIKGINTIMIYLFNLLPKVIKMTIIYSLIALSILEILNIKNPQIKTIIQEKVVEVEKVVAMETENEKTENIVEKESYYTFENKNEQNIYDTSIENGLTHKQALLLISISRHETGFWTSQNFLNKNNFGGIMCNDGTKIVTYNNYEEGLNAFIKLLKNYYFAKGLNSIEEIGKIYCPVGAANDPKGLNKYWIGNVTKFYNDYLAKYPMTK